MQKCLNSSIHHQLIFLFFYFSQISDYSYRAAVRELIPQLRYLDDVQVEEEGRHCSSCTKGDDWAVLRHSIRDPNLPRADMDEGVCVCVCVCLYMLFWLISSSSVDYRSVLNEPFHLHRGSATWCTALQQSSFCQAPSSQPLPCQTLVWLQTTHLLHTHDGNHAWSFISARVQTWFCRPTSSNRCSRNQWSDTWWDTVMTVFHTDVSAVRSFTPHHTDRTSAMPQTVWQVRCCFKLFPSWHCWPIWSTHTSLSSSILASTPFFFSSTLFGSLHKAKVFPQRHLVEAV